MLKLLIALFMLGMLALLAGRGLLDGGTTAVLLTIWLFATLGIRGVLRLLAGILLFVRALGG